MTHKRMITVLAAAIAFMAGSVAAQTPAKDPSDRLREVLPPDVAAQVLATIADARARSLPAQALEQRALKFAAKGVDPKAIAKSIMQQEERMEKAKDALDRERGRSNGDEVEAGAEALRKGVDGAAVSALAKGAPSGRSLAVPLFVIGSLVDRGLPSDDALARVLEKLQARASDAELGKLASLPDQAAMGQSRKPTTTGRPATAGTGVGAGAGVAGRPAGGPPAGVPANGGKGTRPTTNPGRGKKG
ncbi:MAG: hypothetical protein Q7S20_07285 [Gemmatimonadaceae bacterium]|nr:hypothetical protein [Gemmatimonadaceae bacterium]